MATRRGGLVVRAAREATLAGTIVVSDTGASGSGITEGNGCLRKREPS